MQLKIQVTQADKQKTTTLIVGAYEDGSLSPTAKLLDKASKGQVMAAIKVSGFKAKTGQTLPIYNPPHLNCGQVLIVGCGKSGAISPMAFRKINLSAMKTVTATTATTYLAELNVKDQALAWKVKQIAETALESTYRFDYFKSEKENVASVLNLTIHIDDKKHLKTAEIALKQGEAIAYGVTFAKNLGNLPSNICTPEYLANTARELAKSHKSLSINVLNETAMNKLGMGAILGVSQGSANEAFLICLEYKGAAKSKAPIALVGKGITFDTGGNSLKTPDAMVGMKYDMCGAASVLGTIKAAAELKLPINIVGVIPAVENMPGGTAYKPEDILHSLSGQTIEVISTDAEGRLILADALTYCERFKPEVVIDIATLTGAVVIALGAHATGLISNDEKLSQALLAAGTESNDRAWPLPLWDEYQEQIKSPYADMANTGGRSAGTITAGCFLSRFAKKFRWAHLDVAGTAAMMMGGGDRYATGRPVPMLTQFLIDQSKKH